MEVSIVNLSPHPLPEYKTAMAAGMDLHAWLQAPLELKPLERSLVPTGIYLALPQGFEAQIRPRSGLAYKQGVTCLNAPGTIDADYRGEVKVLLVNLSNQAVTLQNGERIAQMVISRHEAIRWKAVSSLDETERGQGGFGSTDAQPS